MNGLLKSYALKDIKSSVFCLRERMRQPLVLLTDIKAAFLAHKSQPGT